MSDPNRFVAPARLIAALTLLSRLLGVGREMVYAYFFGTGPVLSAFRIAWQVPNLFRRLFGEGALSAAFIPVLTDCLHHRGQVEARRLAGAVMALLTVLLVLLVIVAEFGLAVAHWAYPSLTLRLTGLMLPYMPLICLTALVGAMLNVLHRFAAPAFAPVLLNVCIITAALLCGCGLGLQGRSLLYVICGTVLAGGVAQLLIVSVSLRRAGFWPTFGLIWHHPEVRRVAVVMAPMVVGMSAIQINTLADSMIALFFVPDGRGPAVLGYAHFFYQLPLGVFGVALGTAIFPLLSARASAGDVAGLTRAYEQGIRMSLFVGVPAACGLCIIAEPLIRAFFERGEFHAGDAARAASSLVFYGIAVWAYFLQQILVRTFYAMKDSRTPVRVAVTMVLFNLTLNLVLVFLLAEAGVALATALSATMQVGWLMHKLHGQLPTVRRRWLVDGAGRIVLGSIVLVVTVRLLLLFVSPGGWLTLPPWLQVAASVTIGVGAYAAAARVLRLDEFNELLRFRTREG
ncbi:MAG: murein biosynthesis integral membrane protein MurJ [Phycisphaerae bacterium]|nr:murein biosynthesis integral membrane protein MurJ [Phycisphaerae bacterium]